MKKVWFSLPLLLGGCAATAGIGTAAGSIESQINSAAPGIDQILPQLILDKYIAIHNLQWELWQVDQTQGVVVSVPTIGTTSPTPTPVTQPPIPNPSPTPPPNPAPIPTPTPPPSSPPAQLP